MEQQNIIKFEVGKTYFTHSICDHDCIFTYKVIKRTAKFITVIDWANNEKRYKIRVSNISNEEIFIAGNYSMAPCVGAKDFKKDPEQTKESEPIKKPVTEEIKATEKHPTIINPKPAYKHYPDPIKMKETDFYVYYEYLGVKIKARKTRDGYMNLLIKCAQIDKAFEDSVNEIINPTNKHIS